MSEFLIGSGVDRILDQLAGVGEGRLCDPHPPASKSAVESMPTISISNRHVNTNCVVCKDEFSLNDVAREMPCKHIYHQDCILPWLALRNSFPLCRYEMLADVAEDGARSGGDDDMEAARWWVCRGYVRGWSEGAGGVHRDGRRDRIGCRIGFGSENDGLE